MSQFKIILFNVVISLIFVEIFCIKHKRIKFETSLPCDFGQDFAVSFDQVRFSVFDNVLQASGVVAVLRPLEEPLRAEIRLTRCSNSNADQCEHFNNFTIADFCTNLLKNPLFNEQFTTKFDPPFECPLIEGDYYVKNFEFGLGMFAELPVEGFRWTVKLELYHMEVDDDNEEKIYMGCVQGQVRVLVSSVGRRTRMLKRLN